MFSEEGGTTALCGLAAVLLAALNAPALIVLVYAGGGAADPATSGSGRGRRMDMGLI